ncbi:hypothetical protein GK1393 [Geobacillus kaustophilus HTA426]|uniref:Uncharacterized protein n=1 Tax=Geobacillus kaustophilus (strain HTA426) TaxID=235909 RepID=Q5L058_GEOKA|nr:hypothetical protein GK1393 [Geobacillus kaustophilus HTA426]
MKQPFSTECFSLAFAAVCMTGSKHKTESFFPGSPFFISYMQDFRLVLTNDSW